MDALIDTCVEVKRTKKCGCDEVDALGNDDVSGLSAISSPFLFTGHLCICPPHVLSVSLSPMMHDYCINTRLVSVPYTDVPCHFTNYVIASTFSSHDIVDHFSNGTAQGQKVMQNIVQFLKP